MLRLSTRREPAWIELPAVGARIRMRPVTTAVLTAARAEASKRLAAQRKEADAAVEAGMPGDPTGPNAANPNWQIGLLQQYLAEALLRYGAEAWEGVVGEDGAPLPIDAASAEAFAQHEAAARHFLDAVLAPIEAVTAEGNGSAPSSAGGSDGGAAIAMDAAKAAAPTALPS